jgi:ABC-type multidrug transport system fused ATPase/permease subunit
MQYKKSKQEEEEKEIERKKSEDVKKDDDDVDLEKIKLDEEEEVVEVKPEKEKEKVKEGAALVRVEDRMKGSVPWSFYMRFFTGPGSLKAILMFIFITFAQLSRVFSDWWLGEWGSNSLSLDSNTYIIVYAGISVGVGILIYLKGVFFANFIVASSRVIQRRLIQALLHTPLTWFDITPTGRIIARATKDQDDLDTNLAFNVQFASQNLLVLFSSILIISIATPAYLVVAAISLLAYYKLVGLYMNSSR